MSWLYFCIEIELTFLCFVGNGFWKCFPLCHGLWWCHLQAIASASTLKPLSAIYHSALRCITADVYLTHHCILSSLSQRGNKHLFLFIYQGPFLGSCSLSYHIHARFTSSPRSWSWLWKICHFVLVLRLPGRLAEQPKHVELSLYSHFKSMITKYITFTWYVFLNLVYYLTHSSLLLRALVVCMDGGRERHLKKNVGKAVNMHIRS